MPMSDSTLVPLLVVQIQHFFPECSIVREMSEIGPGLTVRNAPSELILIIANITRST